MPVVISPIEQIQAAEITGLICSLSLGEKEASVSLSPSLPRSSFAFIKMLPAAIAETSTGE